MSVLIKGMEMPKCCYDCWALDDSGDYPICRITQEQRGYNFRTREKRMDKCPLVPVPPHGDLIDTRDVNLSDGPYEYQDWVEWALQQYFDAPIFLPADKEEE